VSENVVLNVQQIEDLLPHRPPFLLVDRVVEMEPGKRIVAVKCVTMNEPFFVGHFPGAPVMPGVLIIEAMAQTAAVLVVHTLGAAFHGKLVYFMSIDNARFRRPVVPGDQLRLEVKKDRHRGPVWKFTGVGKVGDQVVAEADFAAMIRDV
jgi:3-hydroxyacyl-[acyl-carrier-protein] dehydratase